MIINRIQVNNRLWYNYE